MSVIILSTCCAATGSCLQKQCHRREKNPSKKRYRNTHSVLAGRQQSTPRGLTLMKYVVCIA